ncbi:MULTISPECIES: 2-amino-4-hydroxy-6-hydroxymethyldihydropteridine diphosphokinase [unclassified Salinibacterium]|uniref:2-amino-4-hydroxy-6- hydroxymethyldihydropteridine diphosphokinase n=1 Tax=unclassified Salinibacterium TaxID=2632331 RepID=UPI001420788E|nr:MULTISPECIES: 2-amino-4-hydroxy-6-hydroxymethyldihydropteridine diphosphokinase [unclassified Salinibacterium]
MSADARKSPDARQTTSAVIAVGANLGDRQATVLAAVRDIAELDGVQLTATSAFIETAALKLDGIDEAAPAYLNGVVIVRTELSPEALLDRLREIEQRHGRVRTERWGDRTLDLDIVSFGDVQQQTEYLTLPHPRAHEREFVLAPWLEIDPDAAIPGLGPVRQLLEGLRGTE